ncbi:MAG: hypothetical protein J0M10_09285 [Chitinophagales bacterium]|nr:hypothetical protein [Chitinophagales bacterium]
MNINRHNYEEYFILYMDNELDAAGRQEVEAFVRLHPDLKEELELLQQFKLSPDEQVVYSGKAELLKGVSSGPVTLQNYEEYLLLYIDNELSASDTAAVEKFINENLAVKKELDLLQFTRLQPELIPFPDKQSLYRTGEKVRAMPVRWWRAAAAILIVGAGLTTAYLLNSNKTSVETANAKPDTSGKSINNPAVTVTESGIARTAQPEIKEQPVEQTAFQPNSANDKNGTAHSKQPGKTDHTVPAPQGQQVMQQPVMATTTDKPSNNLPQPVYNSNFNNQAPDKALAQLTSKDDKNDPKHSLTTDLVTNPVAVPSDDYKTAALTETADGKKNKLRGFFRKVTRTFEKRTNIDPTDEDDRLLVGGLSIKLK